MEAMNRDVPTVAAKITSSSAQEADALHLNGFAVNIYFECVFWNSPQTELDVYFQMETKTVLTVPMNPIRTAIKTELLRLHAKQMSSVAKRPVNAFPMPGNISIFF